MAKILVPLSDAQPLDLLALQDGRLAIITRADPEDNPWVYIYASVDNSFQYNTAETVSLTNVKQAIRWEASRFAKVTPADMAAEVQEALQLLDQPKFVPIFISTVLDKVRKQLAMSYAEPQPDPAPIPSPLQQQLNPYGIAVPEFDGFNWDAPNDGHSQGWDQCEREYQEKVVKPLLAHIAKLEAKLQ